MSYGRRTPIGATVVACALMLLLSAPARGESVCQRSDEVQSLASDDSCRESKWIGQILSDRKDRSHKDRSHHARKQKKDKHHNGDDDDFRPSKPQWTAGGYDSDSAETPTGPRPAAVIPLPLGVWSGLSGLGALLAASGVRRFRRIL